MKDIGKEFSFVGAVVGMNVAVLNVVTYDEQDLQTIKNLVKAVKEEHYRMQKH